MEIGRILGGRYKIVERVGSGGMSTVYKAHEVGLEREVAVKVLITALSSDPQLVERFNREARTIAGLQHNSIIPIYFYGIEDDFGTYLVMPLLKGGTLDQRLEQLTIRPSLTEVGEIAERLGNALQYAHDKGIVHRDIKFSNIMFDDAGNPYLMDFGIAKMLGATNLTGTGMTVGTPQFMPPEQWRNDEITPAVDQYAFAILLYAMLTQRMPFDAPTPHALMYQHLQETPPLARDFREDVPAEIEEALNKALSKNPADRFDSITDFTRVISQKALSATRQYSGFFKAPLSFEKGQTGIGTSIYSANKMPNTPTEMVAKASTLAGTTTPSSNNRETKPPAQVQSEPAGIPPKDGSNNKAFWGGLVATVLVGAIILAGLFMMSQTGDTISPTEDIEVDLEGSATVIIADAEALSVDETATDIAMLALTDEADTDTPVPSDTATSTETTTATSTVTATETTTATATDTATVTHTATASPTATPNATGTQLVMLLTENANQQATDSAQLGLTGTALSLLATEQANTNATATRQASNAESTTQANLNTANTATVEVITQIAEEANTDATNTAIDINNTQQAVNEAQASVTAQSANISGTATAFANIQIQALTQQAEFNATATQNAILAQPTATEIQGDEIQYGQSLVDTSVNDADIRFVFNGNQNDLISISARSTEFDPLLELYQDGVLLESNDDGGLGLNARIQNYPLDSNATYTIVLRTFSGVPVSGEYVIGITEMLDCPTVLPSQMLVGEFGRVTLTGGANRLRTSPTTDGDILVTIPEGDVFEVLAGPICADDFAWYQVDFDGDIGWTAEGDDSDYFLELLPEDDPVLLAGGQGLTNGNDLNSGEFQVEYYCSRRGLNTSNDTIDWFCTNASDVPVLTLIQSDFDQICRDTYDIDDAFALQDGSSPSPAFRWRCYYFPE